MTPRQAAALLRAEIRCRDQRARIGAFGLHGPLPSIAQLRTNFDLTTRSAQRWRQQLAHARREFGA